jgi:peptide deformylase
MKLPIIGYGHALLRRVAEPVTADYPELEKLIEDMYETMCAASGVGLAAPQVNRSIRLFVVDAGPFGETYPEAKDFKRTFINPKILETRGDAWRFNEGCLSVPHINEDVLRPAEVKMEYQNENFEEKEEWFSGICARIIQHEYDHLEGKMFVDRISNLKRTLLKRKLNDIINGKIHTDYKFIPAKRR